MKRIVAHIISIVLIPLLSPTYLFWIILFYFPQLTHITNFRDKILAICYIFGATSLLPFILVFILYKRKIIKNWTLDNKEDRVIPQIFSCFIYLIIAVFLIYSQGVSNALSLCMVAVSISLIMLTIITPYWKISTHASGAWGMFAIISMLYLKFPSANYTPIFYTMLVLTVGVCVARLYLKVHTPMQVLAGSIMGSLIGFSLFYFFLK